MTSLFQEDCAANLAREYGISYREALLIVQSRKNRQLPLIAPGVAEERYNYSPILRSAFGCVGSAARRHGRDSPEFNAARRRLTLCQDHARLH